MIGGWCGRCAHVGAVVALSASICAPIVDAQRDARRTECTANLPSNVFTRVTIHLTAAPVDSASRAVVSSVDLLTQSVATRLRAILGATGPVIPAADSTLMWDGLGAVFVVVHTDGRYTWREPDTTNTARPVRAGETLLRRALAVTRDAEGIIVVPDGSLADSAVFGLSYWEPVVSPTGKMQAVPLRVGFPVFTLPIPWSRPAEAIRPPEVKYPPAPRNAAAEGVLTLRFVVDTTGRVDMSSVRDVWPSGRPRYTGALGVYYDEFVRAATRALEDARYTPAEIGGCRVSSLVMQPFRFKLRR